jgi:hypothetical protein
VELGDCPRRRFQFQKRRQHFIGTHNKASGVFALCGGNTNRRPSSRTTSDGGSPGFVGMQVMKSACYGYANLSRDAGNVIETHQHFADFKEW